VPDRLEVVIWVLLNRPSPSRGFPSEELISTAASSRRQSTLGFALAQGHASVDGHKRVAHAAMATFLLLNDAESDASLDEQHLMLGPLSLSK
jgi:death-on-curing protein